MGKRITQQARGKGSLTFRVRPRAYVYKISYPKWGSEGTAKIVKLFNSSAHSTPLIKVVIGDENFIVPAANGIYEGQEINIGKRGENENPIAGDIVQLKDVPQGIRVFNIETVPGKGGKILRSSGSSGMVMNKDEKKVEIVIKRRRIKLNSKCRAIIGVAAGDGRKMKPIIKAGKKHHMMKAVGRKWHRTSAIKTNAIDHPFGGGRGKRIKSKISKRNSAPGQKVGHISPRRTGRKK